MSLLFPPLDIDKLTLSQDRLSQAIALSPHHSFAIGLLVGAWVQINDWKSSHFCLGEPLHYFFHSSYFWLALNCSY